MCRSMASSNAGLRLTAGVEGSVGGLEAGFGADTEACADGGDACAGTGGELWDDRARRIASDRRSRLRMMMLVDQCARTCQ